MELQGLRLLAVGGASGFALASIKELMKHGAKAAILDLPTSAGAAIAEELGNGTTFHPMNVMDDKETEDAIAAGVEALGGLDAAINTAGGGHARRTLNKEGPYPIEDFRRVIELNLIGTFNCARLQAYHMSQNEIDEPGGERGVIINTASIAAFEGQIGQVSYTAAKAGIAGMTLTMARDLGSMGIRVNTIAPSLFETGLTARVTEEGALNMTKDAAYPKRMGVPHEYALLARAIVENPMLNGDTIRLDGGQRFAPR